MCLYSLSQHLYLCIWADWSEWGCHVESTPTTLPLTSSQPCITKLHHPDADPGYSGLGVSIHDENDLHGPLRSEQRGLKLQVSWSRFHTRNLLFQFSSCFQNFAAFRISNVETENGFLTVFFPNCACWTEGSRIWSGPWDSKVTIQNVAQGDFALFQLAASAVDAEFGHEMWMVPLGPPGPNLKVHSQNPFYLLTSWPWKRVFQTQIYMWCGQGVLFWKRKKLQPNLHNSKKQFWAWPISSKFCRVSNCAFFVVVAFVCIVKTETVSHGIVQIWNQPCSNYAITTVPRALPFHPII